MGNKLKSYIASLQTLLESEKEIPQIEALKQELLTEIGFWQHERLIHLLVTFLFALVTIAVLVVIIFRPTIAVLILFFALLCLLVPYVRHYYILENGVQTLYVFYEELVKRQQPDDFPKECIPQLKGVVIKPLKKDSRRPKHQA